MKKSTAIAAIVAAFAALSFMLPAAAGAIKTWTAKEVMTATDINANFSHIHNTMVGGHGARLVNADVSASAAIAHSKLATPALLPKAWAFVGEVACDGAAAAGTACTIADSSGVTGISANGTAGQYRVNLSYSPPNASFGVVVTAGAADVFCIANTLTGTSGDANGTNFVITCKDNTAVATNSAFSFILMDT